VPRFDILPAHNAALASHQLKPPEIIIRAGQEAVFIYGRLYNIFFHAQNDQFSVDVSDFLEWLQDVALSMSLEHIV